MRKRIHLLRGFCKQVNIRTVNKIFQKSVIDTQQLTLISMALGVDFFRYYSEALKMEENAPQPSEWKHYARSNPVDCLKQ